MLDKVGFLLDGSEVLTYDRSQILPVQQKDYLDKMDKEMDKGIVLVEQLIEQPDRQQKTQFVALNCDSVLGASTRETRVNEIKEVFKEY